MVKTRVNLEMALDDDIIDLACSLKPSDCCLVPEKRQELTTEGGLDVLSQLDQLAQASERLKKSGIRVAYFVDPEPKQIESSKMAGAEVIEIHTGTYADALSQKQQKYELNRIKECAVHATKIGLLVHAGHGLHYENTAQIAAISEILELNIGHSIIAKSLDVGIAKAVSGIKKIILDAR
jgi:pyridoxine 5-phosphate synthase